MAEYTKKWLSVDDQIEKLASRGVEIHDSVSCKQLLRAVGYYRLTGYLYSFRESETYVDEDERPKIRVLNRYRQGTSMRDAAALIDFDRQLRMLVLDGIERIEVSLRMQVGFVLGRRSAFAHFDPTSFVDAFTENRTDPETGESTPSKHQEWLDQIRERQDNSKEAFVAHFREKYDNQMPIWALTEIMEMGHLGKLYGGLTSSLATEIADAYGAPTKKMMASWIASLNYVRNVSAHHARLFNRKLVSAPARPSQGKVPLLDHLKDEASSKEVFGLYNALAVMAYLLRSIESDGQWPARLVGLIDSFPESPHLTARSIGVPEGWADLELWRA